VIAFTGLANDTRCDVNVNEIAGWLEEQVVNTGKATFSNAIDPDRKGGRSGHQYKLVEFGTDNEYVDQSKAPKKGAILAPDYELFGRIYGYKELQNSRITQVNYVIEMTLSNVETGTTAWKKMMPIGKNVPR
jgi:PBP1b-binding outer membrane lipoprotein LpoB